MSGVDFWQGFAQDWSPLSLLLFGLAGLLTGAITDRLLQRKVPRLPAAPFIYVLVGLNIQLFQLIRLAAEIAAEPARAYVQIGAHAAITILVVWFTVLKFVGRMLLHAVQRQRS